MTDLYLITGFLGAGKTTFLHRFAGLFSDKRIAIIVNEFGKTGIDGALLKDLDIELTEINNGSIFCSCQIEQFDKAVRFIMENRRPDLIFVEASGLSDPTAVRAIFAPGAFSGLEYAGGICLVDAVRFHKVYQTARVCRMQLAASDLVLINKTDLASREQIDDITSIALAQKPERPIHETVFGAFDAHWLDEIQNGGGETGSAEGHIRDINLQKLTLSVSGFDCNTLRSFLSMVAEDTYRIKGFVQIGNALYMADCVGPLVELKPYSGEVAEPNRLVVLYGHGLPAKKAIREAIARFPDCQAEIL